MEGDPPVAGLKDTDAEAWDDMCQTVIKESSKEVKKSATAWGKLSSAGKLVQTVASHLTRQEANRTPESDLVLVVGEKFREETNPPQEQGADGEQTPYTPKTISATGIQVTKTTTRHEMVIHEATDATEITTQSMQFKSKTVLSKAVQGKKPRTHMPVITEETAQRGGYSALVTSVDMMLLLMEREVCADDTRAVDSICMMAAITGELEIRYKGCYIAVKGEPNRELLQWRRGVRESIRGKTPRRRWKMRWNDCVHVLEQQQSG